MSLASYRSRSPIPSLSTLLACMCSTSHLTLTLLPRGSTTTLPQRTKIGSIGSTDDVEKIRLGLEPDSRSALSFASWASKKLSDDSNSSSSSSKESTKEKKTRKKGKATEKLKAKPKAKGKTKAETKSDDGDASNASDDCEDDSSCSMSEDESATYVHELSEKVGSSIQLKLENYSKRIGTIETKLQETQKSITALGKKFDSHVSILPSQFSSLKG